MKRKTALTYAFVLKKVELEVEDLVLLVGVVEVDLEESKLARREMEDCQWTYKAETLALLLE